MERPVDPRRTAATPAAPAPPKKVVVAEPVEVEVEDVETAEEKRQREEARRAEEKAREEEEENLGWDKGKLWLVRCWSGFRHVVGLLSALADLAGKSTSNPIILEILL